MTDNNGSSSHPQMQSNQQQGQSSTPSYPPPANGADPFYPVLNQNQAQYAFQASGYVAPSSNVNRNGYAPLPDSNEMSSSHQSPYEQQSPYSQPSSSLQQPYSSPYVAPSAQQPTFGHHIASCQHCNHTYPLPVGATSWRCKQCQKFNSIHGDQCQIV